MPIYSTIWSDDRRYNERVIVLDWRDLGWAGVTRRILAAGADDVVIVNGALGFPERWRDLLIAVVGRLARRGTSLVVTDTTWDPRSVRDESKAGALWSANQILARSLVRAVDSGRTVFCFLSETEVDKFLAETRGPASRAVFTPFFVTVPGDVDDIVRQGSARRAAGPPYVFTGGDTLRDWGLLVDALAGCRAQVRVATRRVGHAWPANFEVGPVAHEDFFALAAGASVGVLTLRSDISRSAGQQTYLNMLRLGLPVVVNDAPGVREHLGDVAGAWITPPADPAAMAARVGWLLDPANADETAAAVAAGQRCVIERYGEAAYLDRIADVAAALLPRART